MKIGIIIHTVSGKTGSFAVRLKDKLTEAGHTVNVEQIKPVEGWNFEKSKLKLSNNPDIGKYDALIFGAPVMAFSLSPVMEMYLNGIKSLEKKKTMLFVTKTLPFFWTGGYQSIAKLADLCAKKNADVQGKEIINIKNRD